MAGLDYVTLMASLPALGTILAAKTPPINRVRLQARLKSMLRPEHLVDIEAAADVLAWERQPLLMTDAEFVKKAQNMIPKIRNETVQRLVRDVIELRTVVAALRRRHAGQDAPAEGEVWGYGRYVDRIRANWREPGFGLEQVIKWLLPAKEKIEKADAAGLERILLEAAWRHADRLIGAHDFDFEAVALYVLRWAILDRWTRYDVEAAAARFGALLAEALDAAPASPKTDLDLMEASS
jgi:hypothetical protein